MKPHKCISGFFAETLQAMKEWDDIFKILKEKNVPTKNKQKPEFINIKPASQEMLKCVPQAEIKDIN